MPDLSADFDGLEDTAILDLFHEVKDGWAERDEKIANATELRRQSWQVKVPKAWRQTAQQQHSSLSKEIPTRVTGTLTLKEPSWSRIAPDEEIELAEKASAVERHFAARVQYDRRTALPGKNGYVFLCDQITNAGAACVGSIYAPHQWAGAPLFMDGEQIRKVHWRDSSGRATDREDEMDYEASERAYSRVVDRHRQSAPPPIGHRVLETRQCYPLFVEGRMLALFVERESTLLELKAGGFVIDTLGRGSTWGSKGGLVEVVTSNRIRYYHDRKPVAHKDADGTKGLYTGYGFVPYAYRVGLEGGSLDWGHYGLPLLDLVDSNIRMIDTCLTYQFNAMHMASFTSWYIKYLPRPDGSTALQIRETEKGKTLATYDFKSGMIMDFGPDKEVQPFLHPGLNKDFDKFLEFQINEVHRIIPRTLQGQAESSGYNTAQTSVQAKAIFNPIVDGLELLLEELAIMDMRHISARVPGPIYLEYLNRAKGKVRQKLQRVRIDKDDIGDYYQIRCTIDREPDRVTMGTWAGNMKAAGILDDEEAYYEAKPEGDYEAHLARQRRDRLMQDPLIDQAMTVRAVKRFGLDDAVREAQAMGRVQIDPQTGMPMVAMPDGRLAGPGQPSAQGGMGATAMTQGQPNLGSTSNPSIEQPRSTPTGRDRLRRRGGAIPGAAQRQPSRPKPENAAA